MPKFPVAASQGVYRLGFSDSNSEPDSWVNECGDNSQDVGYSCQQMYHTRTGTPSYSNIVRNVLFFDTTQLDSGLEILTAGILAYTGRAGWVNGGLSNVADTLYVVTAPGVNRPCQESDYGYIGGRTTVAASLYVPTVLASQYRFLALTQDGIDAIVAEGITPFGIRAGNDIGISFPGWNKRWDCRFHDSSKPAYLYINETPGRFIWIEGDYFAYTDLGGQKRIKLGTLTGNTGTVKYQCWVEGDYWHYIAENYNERRILGSLTGLTGKQPYQISINEKSPMLGTHFCYIDSSGNERCFEGSITS